MALQYALCVFQILFWSLESCGEGRSRVPSLPMPSLVLRTTGLVSHTRVEKIGWSLRNVWKKSLPQTKSQIESFSASGCLSLRQGLTL